MIRRPADAVTDDHSDDFWLKEAPVPLLFCLSFVDVLGSVCVGAWPLVPSPQFHYIVKLPSKGFLSLC